MAGSLRQPCFRRLPRVCLRTKRMFMSPYLGRSECPKRRRRDSGSGVEIDIGQALPWYINQVFFLLSTVLQNTHQAAIRPPLLSLPDPSFPKCSVCGGLSRSLYLALFRKRALNRYMMCGRLGGTDQHYFHQSEAMSQSTSRRLQPLDPQIS